MRRHASATSVSRKSSLRRPLTFSDMKLGEIILFQTSPDPSGNIRMLLQVVLRPSDGRLVVGPPPCEVAS